MPSTLIPFSLPGAHGIDVSLPLLSMSPAHPPLTNCSQCFCLEEINEAFALQARRKPDLGPAAAAARCARLDPVISSEQFKGKSQGNGERLGMNLGELCHIRL